MDHVQIEKRNMETPTGLVKKGVKHCALTVSKAPKFMEQILLALKEKQGAYIIRV